MNNFGVVEVASARTTNAPGWAYVPDTGINPAAAALQPAGRKRAAATRNKPKLTQSDLSARQEAAIRKEVELLDRDNHKDANITLPARPISAASRSQNKHAPNVRKILISQKTFANHLSDFEAQQAAAENSAAAGTPRPAQQSSSIATPPPPPPSTPSAATTTTSTSARRAAAAAQLAAASSNSKKRPPPRRRTDASSSAANTDTEMSDAPPLSPAAAQPPTPGGSTAAAAAEAPPASTILPPYTGRTPAPHPSDADPLLTSRVPPLPSDAELRALLAAPMMPYPEVMARAMAVYEGRAAERSVVVVAVPGGRDGGGSGDASAEAGGGGGDTTGGSRYPARVFCAVCGYWGRVKCIKCGTRVCALDCLDVHREDCVTRYGL